MSDHIFEIQEGHGSFGELPRVTQLDCLNVSQPIVEFDPRIDVVWAELLIDESVISTSTPVQFYAGIREAVFRFPPIDLQPQTVGIRYIARTIHGEMVRINFHTPDVKVQA